MDHITAAAKQQPNQGLTLNSLPPCTSEKYLLLQPRAEVIMQNGSVVQRTRKMHSDIWQFRWREKNSRWKENLSAQTNRNDRSDSRYRSCP